MQEKIFLRALRKEKVERPPFWFMRQAGRYLPEYREIRSSCRDFLELCYTPELAAEVTLQPIRRFAMDAAIIFSDILVIPHALGMNLAFREGEGPVLSPAYRAEDFSRLNLDQLETHVAPVLAALSLTQKQLPPEVALIGFAGAPWTLACYMIEGRGSKDFAAVRNFAYRQERDFASLMALLTEAVIRHLALQIEAGAEAVQLFDSWAGLLPPDAFSRWVIEPARQITKVLKARYPKVPVIGFPRMAGPNYLGYAQETGVDAVSLDYTLPLPWAKESLTGVAIQGNLDPFLLAGNGVAALARAREDILLMEGAPYLFNLGHGVLPQTPVEHVAALSRLLRGEK